jgi:NAD(P)-dependent dehydrogenase (short-subunit alcohol dehydrogenase family)
LNSSFNATPLNLVTNNKGLPTDQEGHVIDRDNSRALPQFKDVDGNGDLFDDSFLRDTRFKPRIAVEVTQERCRTYNYDTTDTGYPALMTATLSTDQVDALVAAVVARFGKLDVLVNNAGIGGAGRLEDTTVEEWDRVMEVNAKGVFLGTKAAIPAMRTAGGGSIINISSQLGLVGMDNSSPEYQSSKGAVRLLTKLTALQYAKDRIRANSVHPGPIITPMTEKRRADAANYKLMVSRIPLGRCGEADEVADGVLYLASDESSYVTGSELVIDGGWTAQ